MYIHYKNKEIRNKLISISNYFYKGFLVKFLAWEPNKINNKENLAPTWFECKKFPLEIKHLQTLVKIGKSLGKLLGIDSDYDQTSNIKFLIEIELDQGKIN